MKDEMLGLEGVGDCQPAAVTGALAVPVEPCGLAPAGFDHTIAACRGCGSTKTRAELDAGGWINCCPERAVNEVIEQRHGIPALTPGGIDPTATNTGRDEIERLGLRHNLWRFGNGWKYGPWRIEPASWIRPHPSVDWDWWHDDYDGAPDANDHRCGSARDRDGCIAGIHAWEDDQ